MPSTKWVSHTDVGLLNGGREGTCMLEHLPLAAHPLTHSLFLRLPAGLGAGKRCCHAADQLGGGHCHRRRQGRRHC